MLLYLAIGDNMDDSRYSEIVKYVMQIDFYDSDERNRRFKILNDNRANEFVCAYVNYLIRNVYIDIPSECSGEVIDLIRCEKLESWCWQTTQMLAPFFSDDSYISRGNLNFFDGYRGEYYHSWLNFSLGKKDYVFDPCLNFLCLKELYDEVFEIETLGRVSAGTVREELIKYLKESRYSLTGNNELVTIMGSNNVDEPFYRGHVGVCGKVRGHKILSLHAHYYHNG